MSAEPEAIALRIGQLATLHGALSILAARDPREADRPGVIVLHGALRNGECMRPWAPVLAGVGEVVLVDMPGHGRSPGEGEATVESFAARLKSLITQLFPAQKVIVIGESVGGIVALAAGDGSVPQVAGVIAADPPLTTAKLWPVFDNFLRAGALVDQPFIAAFFRNFFGYEKRDGKGHVIGDRIYYGLLGRLKVPGLILTGDVPLFPIRGNAPAVPCLIDDVDRMVVRSLGRPDVSVRAIPKAGHLCFDAGMDDARQAVLDFARHALAVPALVRKAG